MSEDRPPGAAVSPDPVETPRPPDPDATAALSAPPGEGLTRPAPERDGSAPERSGQAPERSAPAPERSGHAPERPAPVRPTPPATSAGAPTTVLPGAPARPTPPRPPRPDRAGEPRPAQGRPQSRPAGRRRARLVLQRLDPWSVFLFSLVASICLGVVLLVAVAALYAVLSSLGVLSSLNGVLGEVAGSGSPDEVVEPFITGGRVLGATAVLAAVDVVLLTALATLGALLYNLCASLTGGIEVQLGERD